MTVTDSTILEKLPEIRDDFCKFDRGHLLLIAGSCGMAGASVMAAKAALKSGCGYLSAVIPDKIYPIFTAAVPEAVCIIYSENEPAELYRRLESAMRRADACVVGPGLGLLREQICPFVFSHFEKKLLIDADGLTALAAYRENILSEDAVITPHSGEAGRLLGENHTEIDADREKAVRTLAEKYHVTALLKGKNTLIFSEENGMRCNPTGNAGMAKAGSGDVLSGILGSFMAQGMSGYDAAAAAAWVHGAAGDLAAQRCGMRSMGPFDTIDCIGEILR